MFLLSVFVAVFLGDEDAFQQFTGFVVPPDGRQTEAALNQICVSAGINETLLVVCR